jgi:tripartite-type tricarboxylate transporter receptor subunit TctC
MNMLCAGMRSLVRCGCALRLALVLAGFFAGGLACTAAQAQAQAYHPSKVVRITLPYAAGAGPSVFSRIVADALSRLWGQQVIVDARPGASGFIAIEAVKKLPPDGYELLVASNAHAAINPWLYAKIPYNMETDFVPIGMLYNTPFFVTVSTSGPYQSVRDLIAGAKANPGKLTLGTPYVGSPADLGGALFEFLTGTTLIHVPFKEQPQIYPAIANNDVTWTLSTLGSALPLLNAHRIRLLAICQPSRSASAPDVPTIAEAGGPPELMVDSWMGMFGPRGMPAEMVRQINADLNRVLQTEDIRQHLLQLGFESYISSPEQMAITIGKDLKRYQEVVRRTGARAE